MSYESLAAALAAATAEGKPLRGTTNNMLGKGTPTKKLSRSQRERLLVRHGRRLKPGWRRWDRIGGR